MVHDLTQASETKKPVGMHVVPATGRQFYWTGKVAIGINHQRPMPVTTQGELLVQQLWSNK